MKKDHQRALIRRYLLWCYKMTKEELDRIDRKFTQLEVDRKVLRELNKDLASLKKDAKTAFLKRIDDFKDYIAKKEQAAMSEKYADPVLKEIQPNYFYLQKRLTAIEKAIVHFLGRKELNAIARAYEEEMSSRILESREHN